MELPASERVLRAAAHTAAAQRDRRTANRSTLTAMGDRGEYVNPDTADVERRLATCALGTLAPQPYHTIFGQLREAHAAAVDYVPPLVECAPPCVLRTALDFDAGGASRATMERAALVLADTLRARLGGGAAEVLLFANDKPGHFYLLLPGVLRVQGDRGADNQVRALVADVRGAVPGLPPLDDVALAGGSLRVLGTHKPRTDAQWRLTRYRCVLALDGIGQRVAERALQSVEPRSLHPSAAQLADVVRGAALLGAGSDAPLGDHLFAALFGVHLDWRSPDDDDEDGSEDASEEEDTFDRFADPRRLLWTRAGRVSCAETRIDPRTFRTAATAAGHRCDPAAPLPATGVPLHALGGRHDRYVYVYLLCGACGEVFVPRHSPAPLDAPPDDAAEPPEEIELPPPASAVEDDEPVVASPSKRPRPADAAVFVLAAAPSAHEPDAVCLFGRASDGAPQRVLVRGVERAYYLCASSPLAELAPRAAAALAGHVGPTPVRWRVEWRRCAFACAGAPLERREWLVLRYSFARPSLPAAELLRVVNAACGNAFVCAQPALAAGDLPLERRVATLLVERRVRGPRRVALRGVRAPSAAERRAYGNGVVVVDSPDALAVDEDDDDLVLPPLTVCVAHVTVRARLVDGESRVVGVHAEVADVPLGGGPGVVRRRLNVDAPDAASERGALEAMRALLADADPDVLCGKRLADWTLDVVLRRARAHALADWPTLFARVAGGRVQLQAGAGGERRTARATLAAATAGRVVLADAEAVAATCRVARVAGCPWAAAHRPTASAAYALLHTLEARACVPTLHAAAEDIAGTGGLVLSPRAGRHAEALVYDFAALYPSIVVEYGLDVGASGLLPALLKRLLGARQRAGAHGGKALKTLANALLGALRAAHSPFRHAALADRVAAIGRRLLRDARDALAGVVGHAGVLYGDTDSLFVRAHAGVAPAVAAFNERFRVVRLRIERTAAPLVLTAAKKRYALRDAQTGATVLRGLVRTDQCALVHGAVHAVVKCLLQGDTAGAQAAVAVAEQQLDAGVAARNERGLVLVQALKQPLADYAPSAAHAAAAKWQRRERDMPVSVGTRIAMVAVVGGERRHASHFAAVRSVALDRAAYAKALASATGPLLAAVAVTPPRALSPATVRARGMPAPHAVGDIEDLLRDGALPLCIDRHARKLANGRYLRYTDRYAYYMALRSLGLAHGVARGHMLCASPAAKRTEHAREIDGLQRAADKQWARSVEGSVEAGVPCAEAERRALPMANCHTLCSTLRCPFTGDGALDLLRAKHPDVAKSELARIAALPPVAACDAELALVRRGARVANGRPRHAVLYVEAATAE